MSDDRNNHIQSLLQEASYGWGVIHSMVHNGDAVHGLYSAYVVIEQLSKAYWLNHSENDSLPRTSSIIELWEQLENQPFKPGSFLWDTGKQLDRYQLSGREPEYLDLLRIHTKRDEAIRLYNDSSVLRSNLLSDLPEIEFY